MKLKNVFKDRSLKDLISIAYHKILQEFAVIKSKTKDLKKTNLELAKWHLEQGHLNDAIFRFRIVLLLNRSHQEAGCLLGICLFLRGDYSKASELFERSRDMAIYAKDVEYCIKFIKQEQISTIPELFIKYRFASQIYYITQAQLRKMDANVTRRDTYKFVLDFLQENLKKPDQPILEIGADFALFASHNKLQNSARSLISLEISPHMADFAQKQQVNGKPIYDEVILRNITEISAALKEQVQSKYGAIFSYNTLSFIDDLEKFFAELQKNILADAVFIFSFLSNNTQDREFHYTHTFFTYKPEYIKKILSQYNFELLQEANFNARYTFIIRKSSKKAMQKTELVEGRII